MNHRRRMDLLRQEIRDEQQAMDNCSHGDWTEPIYDPETNQVPYSFKTVGQGSDVWMEPDGYKDETKDRWSRECKKCGKIQYTYTQEPVIVGRKPSFK